jgi:DNA-binding SARP family transcriptional activator
VPNFALSLLGAPILATAEGRAVVPPLGAKPMALLAFLVLDRRPHSREALAGLLWGESPEIEARASLRQAVKQLRECLGEVLQADRANVELAVAVTCDVLEFQSAAEQDPVRAATFDVPRFLEGFSIRRAPQFEEWAATTRATLLRQYQQVLSRLAREAMGQWRWRDAADLADRWLASDPVSDEAAQLAVEARYLSGNRSAALATYAEFRALVAREAGCEPSRALQALVHRVEADRATAKSRPVTDEWYAHAPAFEACLVGREVQWKTLRAAWKGAVRGDGGIVLLEGESGVGKTRLADDFLRWVVAEGTIGQGFRTSPWSTSCGAPSTPPDLLAPRPSG